jgi:membrane-associated phospholipid phosphatase
MADIFLSYAHRDGDRDRAERLQQALSACGWSVFWDHQLLPGETYRSKLASELDRARCVIVLWSHTSIDREWVIDEAEAGKRLKRLISVAIDEVEPPLGFRQGQTASLVDWSGDLSHPGFALLVSGIRSLIDVNPPPVPPPLPAPLFAPPSTPPEGWWMRVTRQHTTVAPSMLLAAIFTLNYIETAVDPWLTPSGVGPAAGYPIADAFHWLERGLTFEAHDTTGFIAVAGYSASYFALFPLMCLFVAWCLARRPDSRPYRALSAAVAIDYLVSLPFFVFFPVPERWSFPDTEAMLLSDKLSDKLIEMIRPISALDNSFPSFHVSLTTLVITACFLFKVPGRTALAAIGATVVLATFVLGIHWIPDMLAGFPLGIASMLLAWRYVGRCTQRARGAESPAPTQAR